MEVTESFSSDDGIDEAFQSNPFDFLQIEQTQLQKDVLVRASKTGSTVQHQNWSDH